MNEETKKILDDIKTLNDIKLKKYVNTILKNRIKIAKQINEDNFIGYELSQNFRYPNLDITDLKGKAYFNYNPFYQGFINKDIKLNYGRLVASNNKLASKGYYYYMNNDEYLYNFLKFIKDSNIEDDIELIYDAYFSVRNYLGVIPKTTRNNLHELILKANEDFFEPTKEHSIKDFKHKGCALCSEYSALIENILSFLGYDISYVIGYMDNILHAFNIIILNDKYCILDSSYGISCYRLNYEFVTTLPYIMPIKDFNNDKLQDFVDEKINIELEQYYVLDVNDNCTEFVTNEKRKYKILTKEV